MTWWRASLLIGLLTGVASVGHADVPTVRVLLVGNSYTKFNVMPTLLRRVANSVPDGPRVQVDCVAHGGYTLRMHWRAREARNRIRRRDYTHVVLQGHSLSPLKRSDEMAGYAVRFGRLIEQRKARAVLYETWARAPEHRFYTRHSVGGPDGMQRQVAATYDRVAARLNATVAPVGRAFEMVRTQAPELSLTLNDGSHPTIQGSYLVALVLYASVSGVDPGRVTYRPFRIDDAAATRIRSLVSEMFAPVHAGGGAIASAPARELAQPSAASPGIGQPRIGE